MLTGAGALTPDGTYELDERLLQRFSLKASDLSHIIERERKEAERRCRIPITTFTPSPKIIITIIMLIMTTVFTTMNHHDLS